VGDGDGGKVLSGCSVMDRRGRGRPKEESFFVLASQSREGQEEPRPRRAMRHPVDRVLVIVVLAVALRLCF